MAKVEGRKRFSSVFSSKDVDEHVQEYKENTKKRMEGGDGYTPFPMYFTLADGETALVRWLEKTPVKFWQHRVYDPQPRFGSPGYRVYSCTREPDCPLCKAGDAPTFKVAWNIVHIDHVTKDGKQRPRVKILVKGIQFAELFLNRTRRFDPTKKNVLIERIGEGTKSQYQLDIADIQDEPDINEEEIVDLEEYFGIDDEKYEDMVRLASYIKAKKHNSGKGETKKRRETEFDDYDEEEDYRVKKGSKSRLEEDEDIPF